MTVVIIASVLALALRLAWQAARDRRRQRTLLDLVTRLPAGALVELDDLRDDGSHLRLRIAPGEPDVRP